jgi:hypothetical protein
VLCGSRGLQFFEVVLGLLLKFAAGIGIAERILAGFHACRHVGQIGRMLQDASHGPTFSELTPNAVSQ